MGIGTNIKNLREERNLTQEQVAEALGITFQAVSSWEREEYKPDTDKLIRLAEFFDVSVSAIAEEKNKTFKTKEAIYNWEHMKTFVKTTAKNFKLRNTLKAVDFAVEVHKGQQRKKSEVPYIYHPLNLACHALSMDIIEDEVIAACLLHDVIEDCGKTAEDLPVNDETKKIVVLLSHPKTTDRDRDKVMSDYYNAILSEPKASLIKCMDRCNNLTTMSWGLSRERIYRMIKETEEYYPALIKTIKATPEYNNAAWLLQYQIESMLDIYKRLM
ncbi:MAG: helix-turn-helix domain-containing protein [Lachnospiraceae bacterium]|nr:helix-turn-helix domain-containing protein [Lachnospiraceae bacterium]